MAAWSSGPDRAHVRHGPPHLIVHAGDLDVEYDERGSGKPVVLVHGNWGSRSWWEPVLDRVPPGFRAISYDLRGRGGTRGPTGNGTFASLAADLGAFAGALGLERFALAGHSLGTAVALQYALDHPGRLSALVVVSPTWVDGMPVAYAAAAHQERLATDPDYFDTALRTITPAAPRDQLWTRIVEEGRGQSLDTALAAQAALVAWSPGARLRAIDVPATVIVGALDTLTTPAVARRAAEALGVDLTVMEGVGHGPMLEAPDRFCEILWERLLP